MTEVVLEQKSQATAVASFGKRNANRERIEREEAELKQLTEKNVEKSAAAEDGAEDDSNLSAEEKSFKKRYGDLRRHSQQQQLTLQKQIDELRTQLTQSTENQIKLPTNEEDLARWAATYPDVAKIVETIAIKKAKEQTASMEQRFAALDEQEKLTAREKAELELMKIHPDFDTIRDTDDFHDWADEQPKWVQQALYENDTDARAAARPLIFIRLIATWLRRGRRRKILLQHKVSVPVANDLHHQDKTPKAQCMSLRWLRCLVSSTKPTKKPS